MLGSYYLKKALARAPVLSEWVIKEWIKFMKDPSYSFPSK